MTPRILFGLLALCGSLHAAEPKDNFGFGGDSGGPEGETAGALEFRKLVVTRS